MKIRNTILGAAMGLYLTAASYAGNLFEACYSQDNTIRNRLITHQPGQYWALLKTEDGHKTLARAAIMVGEGKDITSLFVTDTPKATNFDFGLRSYKLPKLMGLKGWVDLYAGDSGLGGTALLSKKSGKVSAELLVGKNSKTRKTMSEFQLGFDINKHNRLVYRREGKAKMLGYQRRF